MPPHPPPHVLRYVTGAVRTSKGITFVATVADGAPVQVELEYDEADADALRAAVAASPDDDEEGDTHLAKE